MMTSRTQSLGAMLAILAMAAPAAAGPFVGGSTETQRYRPTTQVPVYGGQPYTQQPYAQQPTTQQAPAYAPRTAPAYAQPGYQAYAPTAQQATPSHGDPRMAYRQPSAAENMPEAAESVVPGPSYDSAPPQYGASPAADYSAPTYAAPATTSTYAPTSAGGDCNCNQSTPSYESYTAPATCDSGYYTGGASCDMSSCTSYDCGPRRQWFAGIYGLYMQRDRSYPVQTVVDTTGAPPSYYPMPTDTYLTSVSADPGFAGGAEVRFGSTFGYACNPCGCGSYQPFAWEVGYWALAEDDSQALMTDILTDGDRMYGRINYSGLNLDRDGAGATYADRRLNDYNDYQPFPNATPNDVRVLANRVRQSFQAQNIELNFWRFGSPAPTGGCGYATAAANGCGTCNDACGSCDLPSCGPSQRFFLSGLMGVRFVQFDEFFQNGIYYTVDSDDDGTPDADQPSVYPSGFPTGDNNHFLHDIDVDNDLVGFQLGCSMNCLVGCRWTLFADTTFGIYGNDIDVYQRVYNSGDGTVTFASTGGNAAVYSSKQDVAFLGEWRMGVGYQATCHCRLTLAWRVLGATGVALSSDQIPTAGFTNPNQTGYIHSNGSLLLHGLQAGVECKY